MPQKPKEAEQADSQRPRRPKWAHFGPKNAPPPSPVRAPVLTLVFVLLVAVLVGLILLGLQRIGQMNSIPNISISGVTATERGCLAASPYIEFNVTLSNMAFGNGVAYMSFYQDGIRLGSEQWTVEGRTPSIMESAIFPIVSCGGHAYNYSLDSVTGL